MKILLTGGCGFIGHHLVEHFLKNTDAEFIILDKLGYSSKGFERLRDIQVYDDKRIQIFAYDFTMPIEHGLAQEIGQVDYIIHMGAETHVDNSISNPEAFVKANVFGTFQMLQFARTQKNLLDFFYFSTDEVFGPAPDNVAYKEWDRYNSTNPYSATKAGGEELCLAWSNTYRIPMKITHTMNAFGERQHPEKFIPMTIRNILAGNTVYIHADETKRISGSRFYIHCRNIAAAILFLMTNSRALTQSMFADKYNIVGEMEISNLDLAKYIADCLGKPLNYEMIDFHSSRPGHDLRYALNGDKMSGLRWRQPKNFYESMARTIQWYTDNPKWLEV